MRGAVASRANAPCGKNCRLGRKGRVIKEDVEEEVQNYQRMKNSQVVRVA